MATKRATLAGDPIDPGHLINAFSRDLNGAGAVASFVGHVRSTPDRPVEKLILEHFPELAQEQLEALAQNAMTRFDLIDCAITHRFGTLRVNEPIVLVIAASAHRQAAIDAVNFIMDYLKTDAPFWKKEIGPDGETWVEHNKKDEDAQEKWTSS